MITEEELAKIKDCKEFASEKVYTVPFENYKILCEMYTKDELIEMVFKYHNAYIGAKLSD